MNCIDEARRLTSATHHIAVSNPEWRKIVIGLLEIIDRERKEHAKEIRELERDARECSAIAAAEARHSMNEFGGRDM